jgi:hypothetical protein
MKKGAHHDMMQMMSLASSNFEGWADKQLN